VSAVSERSAVSEVSGGEYNLRFAQEVGLESSYSKAAFRLVRAEAISSL